MIVAMATTSWGAADIVAVADGDWNTGTTWNTVAVPDAADQVEVASGYNVTIGATPANAVGLVEIYAGATVTQTAGTLTFNNMVIGEDTVATYAISGGTLVCVVDSIAVGSGDANGDGTFKIIGSSATINLKGLKTNSSGVPDSKLWLVMDAAGISPINTAWGDNFDDYMDLVVDLTDYATSGESSITLMNVDDGAPVGFEYQAEFAASPIITKGATTLTLGTQGSLGGNQYFIDYEGGAGISNDVVLEVNIGYPPGSLFYVK